MAIRIITDMTTTLCRNMITVSIKDGIKVIMAIVMIMIAEIIMAITRTMTMTTIMAITTAMITVMEITITIMMIMAITTEIIKPLTSISTNNISALDI
jgi:hypothetical protein